ncbi:MAG: hypothetical protein JHC93_07675 [Parachlamydiales bacterium]|nr:hypothetical protein [Parachlamydiales bacterium]
MIEEDAKGIKTVICNNITQAINSENQHIYNNQPPVEYLNTLGDAYVYKRFNGDNTCLFKIIGSRPCEFISNSCISTVFNNHLILADTVNKSPIRFYDQNANLVKTYQVDQGLTIAFTEYRDKLVTAGLEQSIKMLNDDWSSSNLTEPFVVSDLSVIDNHLVTVGKTLRIRDSEFKPIVIIDLPGRPTSMVVNEDKIAVVHDNAEQTFSISIYDFGAKF